MDTRIDDSIAELTVRSDDSQEIKSIELLAHSFRVDDGTGAIVFTDEQTRQRVLEHVEKAILLAAGHSLRGDLPRPAGTTPSRPG